MLSYSPIITVARIAHTTDRTRLDACQCFPMSRMNALLGRADSASAGVPPPLTLACSGFCLPAPTSASSTTRLDRQDFHILADKLSNHSILLPSRSRNLVLHRYILQNVGSFDLVTKNAQGRVDRALRLCWILRVGSLVLHHSATAELTRISYDGLKKTEIEVGLDEYLSENATQFSDEKRLAPFYKTRGRGSPVKKEMVALASDIESTVKSVKRRVTKAAEELLAT
jgi:hypothetical protein